MPNLLAFSPAVDVVTDKVAVVMQDRPVIGASSWLVDAFAAAAAEDRHLQLVTRTGSRLTYPVRSRLFAAEDARWVVNPADGDAYDGLSGLRLDWDGERFAPVLDQDGQRQLSPAYLRADPGSRPNLHLNVRVRHQPFDTTVLGRSAETLFTALTGAAPVGWGTEEPVSQPWDTGTLTAYCRRRVPRPSWLALVGGSGTRFATGAIEVHRRESGVEETVSIAVGEFVPPDEIQAAIARLAGGFEILTVVAMTAPGTADTTIAPHLGGLPAPIGIGLGNAAARGLDLPEVLDGVEGRRLGPASRAALWFEVGDGTDQDGWNRYASVARLLADAERAVTPPRPHRANGTAPAGGPADGSAVDRPARGLAADGPADGFAGGGPVNGGGS